MANLGSDTTDANAQSLNLPSGYTIDEDGGDLVIRDTGGAVTLRRTDGGAWSLENNDLNSVGTASVTALEAESVSTEVLRSGPTKTETVPQVIEDFERESPFDEYDDPASGASIESSDLQGDSMLEVTDDNNRFGIDGINDPRGLAYRVYANDVDGGVPGFAFAYQDEDNMYLAQISGSSGDAKLRIVDDGSFTDLASDSFSLNEGEWYAIEVEFGFGGFLSMTVYDDELDEIGDVTATDTTFDGGSIGFRNGSSSDTAYYDYITRRPL